MYIRKCSIFCRCSAFVYVPFFDKCRYSVERTVRDCVYIKMCLRMYMKIFDVL